MKLRLARWHKILLIIVGLIAIAFLLWWLFGRGGSENRSAIDTQKLVGLNTGYHLEVDLDQIPFNPYPGTTVTGRVWVADSRNRQVRDVTGGVWLYVQNARTGLQARNLGRDQILVGTTLVDPFVSNYSLSGPVPGQWKIAEDGSNRYTFAATGRGNLPNATFAYLTLENGSADFTYVNTIENSLAEGRTINIVAATIEQPLYAAAQNQYLEDRVTPRNLDGTINTGEPTSVRKARESQVLDYQLIPLEKIFQLQQRGGQDVLPTNQDEAAQADNRTTLIQTTVTVPFANFTEVRRPDAPAIIESTEDYYYELTFAPSRLTRENQEFTVTVRPVAKSGKRLPSNIGDVIELGIAQHYPVIANDYPAQFTADNKTSLQDNFMSFISHRPPGAPAALNDTIYFVAGASPTVLKLQLTGRKNLFGFVAFDAKVFNQIKYEELQDLHNGRAPQAEILKLKTMRLITSIAAPIIQLPLTKD